ncbi:MAG: DUF1801 domain-containing protein [Myxococcales bacterium]|nr:DUF1801 domain-containing protein [Myxococcales bacterium]
MTRNADVDAFLDEKAHPLRTEIDHLRDTLLGADARLQESIKWGGPTFSLVGTRSNLGTITLRGKKAITLYLPEGASLPDPHGLLKGDAAHVRTARFASIAEIDAATNALRQLVTAFVARHAA